MGPRAAGAAVPPVDPELDRDIAEAHQLGIDAEFIDQIRIMTPRTRATILTDFRGTEARNPPRASRRDAEQRPSAGAPPRQRHRPSPGGAAARGRRGRPLHFDRHDRYEDAAFPDDYDMDDFYEDEDDEAAPGIDDNTWEHEDTNGAFPHLPPGGGMGRGRAGGLPLDAQAGDPAMMLQMLLMQSMMAGGGRGGGRVALPRGMEHALQQAHANAQRARDMGAGLDVDNMSYEELLALQERVGHVSKGLGKADIDRVSSLCAPPAEPSPTKAGQDADADSCVICMTEFAATRDNDCRRIHVCGHLFHDACLTRWLKDNKKCPICNRETA